MCAAPERRSILVSCSSGRWRDAALCAVAKLWIGQSWYIDRFASLVRLPSGLAPGWGKVAVAYLLTAEQQHGAHLDTPKERRMSHTPTAEKPHFLMRGAVGCPTINPKDVDYR